MEHVESGDPLIVFAASEVRIGVGIKEVGWVAQQTFLRHFDTRIDLIPEVRSMEFQSRCTDSLGDDTDDED